MPEIEIPLTIDFKEMDFFKTRIDAMAKEIMEKENMFISNTRSVP